jgi:hypothetical protein
MSDSPDVDKSEPALHSPRERWSKLEVIYPTPTLLSPLPPPHTAHLSHHLRPRYQDQLKGDSPPPLAPPSHG